MASVKQQQCETEYYHIDAMIDKRYRLTQFIGAGGMACVYRAKEEGSPHEFALKFLKSEYHNMPYLIEYFRDEASSMRDLAHPNIVRFYRFVNNEHYSYIIMDFVDGFALSEVIKLSYKNKDFMPLDEVARVMTQVARALDAIHREGYVHRDIKPSNVLIDRKTGRAFLTDLGITSASNTMMEGAGTMAYMSPEQAETWVADHRSDVYSFGVMVFEMLSTHRPFSVGKGLRGAQAEADLLRKHKEAEVPDITQYHRGLPKELNTVLGKGLAKNPDDRYQNIMDFANDIHNILKPKLSSDLQDFTQIKHRQIEAPTAVDESPILRILLVVGVVAIILAGLLVYTTVTGPATPTPAPTVTPTPDPFTQIMPLTELEGVNALADLWDDEVITLPALSYEPLHFLRVPSVEGFRVRLMVESDTDIASYGVAYRIQDETNYQYFAIRPSDKSWRIVLVENNVSDVRDEGNYTEFNGELIVSGANRGTEEIFRFDIGGAEQPIINITNLHSEGRLALYVEYEEGSEGANLVLSELQISLVDATEQQATAIQTNSDSAIANLLRHLYHDVEAINATNDRRRGEVNCENLTSLYDNLDRHDYNRDSRVKDFITTLSQQGATIYDECQISLDGDFGNDPSYEDWGDNINNLLAQIEAAASG